MEGRATGAARLLEVGRELVRGLADLVYPPVCFLCRQLMPMGEARFCAGCSSELGGDTKLTCPRCAETVGPYAAIDDGCPHCRRWPLHFEAAWRLGPYEGALAQAILRLKDSSGEDLAEALGRFWAERLAAKLLAHQPAYVVPVPLHWLRRLQRGYNQAETLALALAERLGIPCRPRWLWRTRHTPHQMGLSVTARRENVKNAFRARPRQVLRGKTLVLVDDVMTTGSTCSEAAKALKQAGAARIVVAVLAKSTS